MTFLSKFRINSLGSKLTLALGAFSLIPLVSLVTAVFLLDNTEQQAGALIEKQTFDVMDKIERNLSERYGDVQAFGMNKVVGEVHEWYQAGEENPIVQVMNQYVDIYDIYLLTLLVDPSGSVIAVNSHNRDGNPIATAGLYDKSFAQASWLEDAMAGRFLESADGSTTGTVVEDVHNSSLVNAIYPGNANLAVTFSAPIRDDLGDVLAVWHNVADFALVEEVFHDSYEGIVKSVGTPDVEMTLLSHDGTFLVDYDPHLNDTTDYQRNLDIVLNKNLAQMGVEIAQQAVREGGQGHTISAHARKKIDQLGAYVASKGSGGYAGLGWIALVRVRADAISSGVTAIKAPAAVLLVLTVVVGMMIGSLFARSLTKPVQAVLDAIDHAAAGDLTATPEVTSRDEIGAMAVRFGEFLTGLRESVGTIKQQGEKLDDSSSGLAGVATRMAEQVSGMKDQSLSVAATTEEMSTNINTVAGAVEESSSNIRNVASAVEEMSTNLNHVSEKSTSMTEDVESVASAISEMSQSLGGVSERSSQAAEIAGRASESARRTNEIVGVLGQSAQEIGKVVGVINDIAEQTNLLALNATIEAASAGEAGRGFAVVANEVKELAKQTAQATDEIRQKVEGMQGDTQSAVAAIGEIVGVIDEINQTSQKIARDVEEQRNTATEVTSSVGSAAEAVRIIHRNVQETSEGATSVAKNAEELAHGANEISSNAAQASQGANEVASGITGVSEGVRETAGGAGEVESAAREMSELAQRLGELVNRYQV